MEVSGQLQDPVPLPQGNQTQCLLQRRLGEPQSRSGSYGEEENVCP
jgi:hypothetical protein